MATITFDTHKFIQTLQAAGFGQEQAEAVSNAFKEADLAIKADIREVKTEVDLARKDMAAMEARIMGELKLNRWMLALIVVAEVAPLLAKLFHA